MARLAFETAQSGPFAFRLAGKTERLESKTQRLGDETAHLGTWLLRLARKMERLAGKMRRLVSNAVQLGPWTACREDKTGQLTRWTHRFVH
jgi:hypothetical protein